MSVVIVGAGHAAHQFAHALREFGWTHPVTMLGEESYPPYQRPPLSKSFLTDPVDPYGLMLGTEQTYLDAGITVRLNERVVAIDRANKVVSTNAGHTVPYSRLILATGARNRLLQSAQGVCGVVSVRGIDDALSLRRQLENARNVTVVGGGLLGLEFACVARKLGCDVTVIESGDRIMQRVLRPETAEFVYGKHLALGLKFKLRAAVSRFLTRNGQLTAVQCSDGEEIGADIAVVAIGVIANDGLAAAAGLDIGDGIVVRGMFETSDEAIHAIGDCARVEDARAEGKFYRIESVQSATDQARLLARYVVDGQPAPADVLPTFWSKQGDVTIHIVGHTQESESSIEIAASSSGSCRLCFAEGWLIGAECVNSFRNFRNVSRFLKSGGSISSSELSGAGAAGAMVGTW
jgi:3-phenylpropionate/trans-cinnamate dioxygenase ferredoxin reductase subunit